MKQPRITIVTPNYNRGRFLERTICSVLDQGYENLEYFVIDGGSTDDSVDIIRFYKDDLDGWVSEPDAGCGDAINKGLARATGDIVGFLDAGDLYLPGALDTIAKQMSDADNSGWVIGQCEHIDGSDHHVGVWSSRKPDSLASYLMRDSGFLPRSATFLTRHTIESNGLFDDEMRFGSDFEYWSRLIAHGQSPSLITETVTARRDRPDTRTATDTMQRGVEYITAATRYADYLTLTQRYALWANCDMRRRIYTLAEAETRGHSSRRFLWQQLVRHPWWIANDAIRDGLIRGNSHPLPRTAIRQAA